MNICNLYLLTELVVFTIGLLVGRIVGFLDVEVVDGDWLGLTECYYKQYIFGNEI